MPNSVQPHRQQPTRLPHPWDSPGKNTGVGCHFLPQCMKGKRESEVTQSCPTLRDPMVCSLQGSSVHGIFQARVLEWDAIAFSMHHSSQPQRMFWKGLRIQHQGEQRGPLQVTTLCSWQMVSPAGDQLLKGWRVPPHAGIPSRQVRWHSCLDRTREPSLRI